LRHRLYPSDFWQGWNFDPRIAFILGLLGWRYMDAFWKVWNEAGQGRGISRRRVVAFWVAVLVLLAALVSPLDALSETLLSAHMIQHLLLILAAPLLLAYALPVPDLIRLLPRMWRQRVARWGHRQHFLGNLWKMLTQPVVIAAGFAFILWGWHLPGLYEAALRSPMLHILEHLSFVASAYLLWWRILDTRQLRSSIGSAIMLAFVTALHSGLLGVLLLFSASNWYTAYDPSMIRSWGLTPLADQQIAGLLMWLPGSLVYLVAALALLGCWFQKMEERYSSTTAGKRGLARGNEQNRQSHISGDDTK